LTIRISTAKKDKFFSVNNKFPYNAVWRFFLNLRQRRLYLNNGEDAFFVLITVQGE